MRQVLWGAVVASVCAGAAFANPDTAPDIAPDTVLDTIVITAERRERSKDDLAQNITLLNRDLLQRIDANHIAEALARVPGVNLHRGSGTEHLTAIRSPVLTAGAGAGSFLFLENGVPLRAPGFANINGLFEAHAEIAHGIEVIRGPSGALYGANAIHGVVNVLTPAPSANTTVMSEGFGDTQDRYKGNVTASGTIRRHGLFAGLSAVTEAGYRKDAGLDQQKLTLRHTFDGNRADLDTIVSVDNLEQETAGYIFGEAALRDRALRRDNAFPYAYRDAKSLRLQSTLSADIGTRTKVRITPYGRWNTMVFPQHFLPSNALEKNGHWSIGVQSAVYQEFESLSLIGGLDAEYTRGSLSEFQDRPQILSYTPGVHYDYTVRATTLSGFLQSTYKLNARTSVLAAIRLDGTIYDYDNLTGNGVTGRFLRPADRTDSFGTASPKLSILHDTSGNTSVYASYTRGARPPQTTDLYRMQINQTGAQARPEKIDAWELGLRTKYKNRFRADLTAFWMKKSNFFFRDADGFNVVNGRTRHIGVEADISVTLYDALRLQSALTYAAHTYRFDRPTGNASETITSGNDIDTAPRVIANTRLTWTPAPRVTVEAEWAFLGRYYTDAANDHTYDGHNLLHLRSEAVLSDTVSAFIALRNVTNELYAERADFAFGSDRYFPGETRTAGFGIRCRF